MLLTIIIPTYNEATTIQKTIYQISKVFWRTNFTCDDYEILVVDDNYPDGTGDIVRELSTTLPVRLITRTQDPGLSQSVIEGFAQAKGNIIIVTDSDGSHDLLLLPQMYSECKTHDIVIGSRYMKGGDIRDWPIERRIISFGATFLARILFPCTTDPVSGFFAVKRDLVHHVLLKPCGYKILLEILGKSYWHTITELPYTFTNRCAGTSKLRTKTIFDFIKHLYSIARFPGRASREITKIKKFAAVGFSGVFVNSIALAFLVEWLSTPLVGASFIAVEIAIISNFLLNDSWTFKDHNNTKPWLHRLLSFNALCVGGMVLNVAVLGILSSFGLYYLISNLFGIGIAMSWNFLSNRRLTWSDNK
jgi:dolichol-phosphate mannosyltransferase